MGCPNQTELPVKFKCQTIEDRYYMSAPFFGHCIDGKVDDTYVVRTIRLQERLLKHQNHFLHIAKQGSRCCLLRDKKFMDLLMRLISPNHFQRPSIQEIVASKFIVKNTTSIVDRMKNINVKREPKCISKMLEQT